LHRVFLGPAKHDAALADGTAREAVILFALALLLLVLGLYPQPVLNLTASLADALVMAP
jgi:NADH-quinone oxidoreductase subunit M